LDGASPPTRLGRLRDAVINERRDLFDKAFAAEFFRVPSDDGAVVRRRQRPPHAVGESCSGRIADQYAGLSVDYGFCSTAAREGDNRKAAAITLPDGTEMGNPNGRPNANAGAPAN